MRVTAFACSLLVLGACSPDGQETATTSLQNIAEIRSGELTIDVGIAPAGEEEATGFALEGVFSLPDEAGALPEADLLYTQRVEGAEVEGRFISNGDTIFVEVDGGRTELPPDQIEDFKVTGSASDGSVFGALDVEEWFSDPTTEEAGDEVTLSGELDVVAALNDIFEVARNFGATIQPIEGSEADIVAESVRSARAEITSGAEDGLLRGVSLEIDFGVTDQELAEALGPLAGATFTLELDLSNVNEPVDVE